MTKLGFTYLKYFSLFFCETNLYYIWHKDYYSFLGCCQLGTLKDTDLGIAYKEGAFPPMEYWTSRKLSDSKPFGKVPVLSPCLKNSQTNAGISKGTEWNA